MTKEGSALPKRAPGDTGLFVGQAIGSQNEAAGRSDDLEQQALCPQAIAALRQVQAEEP